jgi:hypothetical protein
MSNGVNIQLQNIPSSKCGIHILLTSSWTFYKTDPIVAHKACLNKYKKMSNFNPLKSNSNGMKLEISRI